MSLREIAALDLRAIVENADDFGWPITVTSPDESALDVVGLSTDVGLTIDPQTGMGIAGRRASVAITLASIESLGVPKGVADKGSKPWRVAFADIMGERREYKVVEAMPDRAVGLVTCVLETYRAPT